MPTIERNSRSARTHLPRMRWPSPGMSQPATRTTAGRLDFSSGIRWAICCVSAAIGVDCISASSADSIAGSDAQELGLARARDNSFAGPRDHIHLAADTELAGKVDAGLDGEAGVGQQDALIVCLEIVQMRAVAVQFTGDVMTGAVREKIAEPSVADDVAGGVVGLPAGDGGVGGVGLFDGGDGGVAGLAHDGEDVALVVGGLAADDAGPGDVVPDGIGAAAAGVVGLG